MDEMLDRITHASYSLDPTKELIAKYCYTASSRFSLIWLLMKFPSDFWTKIKELKDGYTWVASKDGMLHYLSDYSKDTLVPFYDRYGDYVIGIMSLKEIHLLNSNWKEFITQKYMYHEDFGGIYKPKWKRDNEELASGLLKEFVAGQRQAIAQYYAVNEDQPAEIVEENASGGFPIGGSVGFGPEGENASLQRNKSHAGSGYASRGRGSPIDESGGDGGSRGQIDYVKPKAKQELWTDRGKSPISEIVEENALGGVPIGGGSFGLGSEGDHMIDYVKPKAKQELLTDRGKSPVSDIVEENAWGGSPMQRHEPSDKPCRLPLQDVHKIIDGRGERDGGDQVIDLEMGLRPHMIVHTEGKPKSGESGGDGGSRGQIDYVKPKAKQEPLTDRGKSPISEENAWGESPMQGHKPSDKPIGQGMVVASASGTNEGRVDLEMQKLDSQQKVKPKSGVQTVTKILLASSLPAGHSLSSMAKGSSISRPIYCFTAAATSIVVLGCLLALMVADKHPKLAGYAGKLAIFFASIAFFSTFFI